MMKILLMAAAFVIGSSAGSAATGKGEASSRAKGAAAASTIYCLPVEGTGSRLARKVCMTAEQWRADGVEVNRK